MWLYNSHFTKCSYNQNSSLPGNMHMLTTSIITDPPVIYPYVYADHINSNLSNNNLSIWKERITKEQAKFLKAQCGLKITVSHTYLQRYIWIHSKFGDFISPRQELLSFVVQVIIKDCSLGWKFHCFHLFMPPPTEFSLISRNLRITREILIADLKVILNTHKAPPNPAEHTVFAVYRIIITNGIK